MTTSKQAPSDGVKQAQEETPKRLPEMDTQLINRFERRIRELGLPLGVRLWNGNAITPAVEPRVTIALRTPKVLLSLLNPSMGKLARHPNIVGVKDATGDLSRVEPQAAECGPDFIQLSGEDATTLGFLAHGGRGCISVTSNVAPWMCAQIAKAALANDFAKAREINAKLVPLHSALFCSPSPGPAKYALSNLGLVAYRQHDYGAALQYWEQTTRFPQALRGRLATALTIANLADLRLRLGLVDHAEHALAFGKKLFSCSGLGSAPPRCAAPI